MGWWFGRKSAPADARPFVPAWLCSDAAEEGFARSLDGMIAFVKSEASWAVYQNSGWEFGTIRGSSLILEGQQVVGERASAIASPAGGSTIDVEARSAIGQILSTLRSHGLIET
jgi:hypothetical protein